MASDRPDPGEFLEMAQRMLRELFGGPPGDFGGRPGDEEDPWAGATRRGPGSFSRERSPEPSAERQRENLTFALATRAVEALEDLALNVAAIRQRLERIAPPPAAGSAPQAPAERSPTEEQPPGSPDPL